MDNKEFLQFRHYLGKTQTQIAQLLGVSSQAVHSFEQGWRKIPTYIQRQLLLFLYLKRTSNKNSKPCWEINDCLIEWRRNCVAWEYKAGNLCWFINGTFCQGKYQDDWEMKIELCVQCKVFVSIIPTH
jgi:hypothetical protein